MLSKIKQTNQAKMSPFVRQIFLIEIVQAAKKGLLSVNCRRQALQFCLDPAVVVVIQICNEFQLEVFHGAELLQIQQLTFEQPKKKSITALSRQFPLRLMLC